jgi:hypothetical protein
MARTLSVKFDSVPPETIKAVRTALGFTQTRSGQLVGATAKQWHKWEHGYAPMNHQRFQSFKKKARRILTNRKKKENAMTPQEAILKQTNKTMKPLDLTQSQKKSMAQNAKIWKKAFNELSATLENYKTEAKEKLANKLFGENGTMRTRTDPEANGMRAAVRKHVRKW